MKVFELTKKLVNIPSLAGDEDEIADFLSLYLEELGFDVREQKIEERRRNIFARSGPKPRVMLCTHMDTVPEYFGASEDDNYLYGRGACDAKGILASMILASQELKQEGLTEVGLLFVVGEETDSIGAKMAEATREKSEFIIVGEPTENKLGIGHKGVVTLKIHASGKAAHSASPHASESAIEKLLDILQTIRQMDFGQDPVLGQTTVNIGMIEGGLAPNVIPSSASAKVSLRTSLSSEKILERIREASLAQVEIEVLTRSEPQTLFTVPGFEKAVLPFGSDIPYLKSFGKPLLIGPGSVLDAHTETEKIDKRQLLEAVPIYKKLVRTLLALKE